MPRPPRKRRPDPLLALLRVLFRALRFLGHYLLLVPVRWLAKIVWRWIGKPIEAAFDRIAKTIEDVAQSISDWLTERFEAVWDFFVEIAEAIARFFSLPKITLLLFAVWLGLTLYEASTAWHSFVAGMRRYSPDHTEIEIRLAISLWSLVASFVLAGCVFGFFEWGRIRRLIFGCLATCILLGSLGELFYLNELLALLWDELDIPLALIIPLAPVAMALATLAAFVAVAAIGMALFYLLIAIPTALFVRVVEMDNALRVFQVQADHLAGRFGRAAYWMLGQAPPDPLPDESRGARLATRAEVEALNVPFERRVLSLTGPLERQWTGFDPRAIRFGHVDGPLRLLTEKHVLIMASTRSGKGVTLIIPHLLTYAGSAFVLDPKGENAKATGRHRRRLNRTVHYLDPFGISGQPQSRFNPLARFTPENMEAESKALAAALFIVGDRDRGDHWSAGGQQLLASIILYVFVSPDIPPENKDLPTVRRLLLGNLKPTLDAMVEMDDADGLLCDLAVSFKETPEKEFGSIVSTAQRQTEILDNPSIIACLSAAGEGQEVDFTLWHTNTMTVYLCLSAPKFPVFNRWLRLVLASALDEMTDALNSPPLPVCFMLDELATLGHMQTVENAIGLAAGYGIQLVTVFQDIAQMRDLYKSRWASFIANAGVRAIFNLDDFDTAEYWSKFIGGRIATTSSGQQDVYGTPKSQGTGEAVRPLFPPDKLMMDFAAGQMLVLVQGARPIISKRIAYFEDPELEGLWDDPRVPVTPRPQGGKAKPRPRPKPTTAKAPEPAPPDPPQTPQQPQSPAPITPVKRGGVWTVDVNKKPDDH